MEEWLRKLFSQYPSPVTAPALWDFFFSGGALPVPSFISLSFPTLLLLGVFWALLFPSSHGYFFPCSFPSEVPSLSEQFLGNPIMALYFRITWELHLRVFHYYFITQCQASQLQTQMKRSFSFIFKSPHRRQWYLWSQTIWQQMHRITLSGVLINNCLEFDFIHF